MVIVATWDGCTITIWWKCMFMLSLCTAIQAWAKLYTQIMNWTYSRYNCPTNDYSWVEHLVKVGGVGGSYLKCFRILPWKSAYACLQQLNSIDGKYWETILTHTCTTELLAFKTEAHADSTQPSEQQNPIVSTAYKSRGVALCISQMQSPLW